MIIINKQTKNIEKPFFEIFEIVQLLMEKIFVAIQID